MTLPSGSPLLRGGFIALSIAVALLFPLGVRRVAGARSAMIALVATVAWLALTAALAMTGMLRFQAPPSMLALIAVSLAGAVALAWSTIGARLAFGLAPATLVGFQAFRIGVELLLHRAYLEGLMPIQMSYAGRNFDMLTGLAAIPVALWVARRPRATSVLVAWNITGLGLLLNVLVVALLSTPTPIRQFWNEPANVWIAGAPWVWLPTVLVFGALFGHALVFRRVWSRSLSAEPATT